MKRHGCQFYYYNGCIFMERRFMERRLGHFFLNNEIFFQHQILTF